MPATSANSQPLSHSTVPKSAPKDSPHTASRESSADTTLAAVLSGSSMKTCSFVSLKKRVSTHCASLPCLPTTVSISTAQALSMPGRAQKSA